MVTVIVHIIVLSILILVMYTSYEEDKIGLDRCVILNIAKG